MPPPFRPRRGMYPSPPSTSDEREQLHQQRRQEREQRRNEMQKYDWQRMPNVPNAFALKTPVGVFRVEKMRRAYKGTWQWMIKGPTGEALQKFIPDQIEAIAAAEQIIDRMLEEATAE